MLSCVQNNAPLVCVEIQCASHIHSFHANGLFLCHFVSDQEIFGVPSLLYYLASFSDIKYKYMMCRAFPIFLACAM